MKGNKLSMLHGAYSKRILSKDEQAIYEAVSERARELYELDEVADEIILHHLAFHAAKAHTSQMFGVQDAYGRHLSTVRKLLSDLDVRRDKREDRKTVKESPQALILAILAKVQGPQAPALPEGNQAPVIDGEVVEGEPVTVPAEKAKEGEDDE